MESNNLVSSYIAIRLDSLQCTGRNGEPITAEEAAAMSPGWCVDRESGELRIPTRSIPRSEAVEALRKQAEALGLSLT